MSEKGNRIYFLVAMIVLMFFLGVFVNRFQGETRKTRIIGSGGMPMNVQTAPGRDADNARSELLDLIRKLESDNAFLRTRNEQLLREKSKQAAQPAGDSADPALISLKEKLDHLSSDINGLSSGRVKEGQLTRLLRSMYKELSSIESSLARIAEQQPVYEQKLREKEGVLKDSREEISRLKKDLGRMEKELGRQEKRLTTYADYKDKFEALNKEYRVFIRKVSSDTRKTEELQSEIAGLQKEKESYQKAERETQEKLREYNDRLAQLSREKDDIAAELERAARNSDELNRRIASLEEEKLVYQKGKKDTLQQLTGYSSRIEQFDKEKKQLADELARMVQEKEVLVRKNTELRDLIQSSQSADREREEQLSRHSDQVARLTREKEEAVAELTCSVEKNEQLSQKVVLLEQEKESYLEEKKQLQSEISRYSVSLDAMEKEMARAAGQAGSVQEYKSKYDELQASHKELAGKAEQDARALEKISSMVRTLQDERNAFLIDQQEKENKVREYETEMTRLAGEKEQLFGRLKQIVGENEQLTARIKVLNEERQRFVRQSQAGEEKLAEYAASVKQLEEALARKNESLTAYQTYKEKFEMLNKSYEQLAARAAQSEAVLAELKGKISSLEKEKERLLAAEKAKQEKLDEYTQLVKQLVLEKEDLLVNLNKHAHEASTLSAELKSVIQQRDEYDRNRIDREKEIARYLNDIKGLSKEISRIKGDLAVATAENGELKTKTSLLDRDKAAAEKDKTVLEREVSRLSELLHSREESASRAQEDLARSRNEYENINKQYMVLSRKADLLNLDLAKRAEKIVSLQEKLEEKDRVLVTVKGDLEDQYREMAMLRETMVKVRIDNTALISDLEEKEAALTYFKQEIKRITDLNSQFKNSLDRVSTVIDEPSTRYVNDKEKSDVSVVSASEEKKPQVEVEINSVVPEGRGR